MSKLLWAVCLSAFLILAICPPADPQTEITYTTKLTSGPFLVAPLATSIDWLVLNNDVVTVNCRVTVYRLDVTGAKVAVSPGPLTISLEAGETKHNANSVGGGGPFFLGGVYEVVVEATSEIVHPNVNQWSCNVATCFIPGTLIPAGDFVPIDINTKPHKK